MDKMGMHQLPGESREYTLECEVQKITETYKEISDGKQHETTSVILVPRVETTEASRFFTTYLPDTSTVCLDCGNEDLRVYQDQCPKCGGSTHTEYSEVPSWIAYPVDGPARLAVLRKNNYCPKHHLYVMSTGAEQDLLNMVGKKVQVKILPTLEDSICDVAKSVDRSVKTKYKNV